MMDLDENIVKEIDTDLQSYEDYLLEISTEIRESKVSKYPIFVLHQQANLDFGKPVIDKERSKTKWSVNVSLIEEFVNKKIIEYEKAKNFTQIYKDAETFICIFLVTEKSSNFIFRPYSHTPNLKK